MKTLNSMSLRYQKEKLEILDQTLLPMKEVWQLIEGPKDMEKAIKDLQVRGAPLIGVAAAVCLGRWAELNDNLDQFVFWAKKLRESRPTAVNLMVTIDRLLSRVDASKQGDWRNQVVLESERIFFEDVDLCESIGKNGASVFCDCDRILTHCNTGGLATVGMGTALGVINFAHREGKQLHVFVDETRPLLQGGRLTTYELEKLKIPFTLICDNMAASLMRAGKVDKVIVGADRIAANGDFANKIGTYSLAVLCKFHSIPFYVAAPYTTLDLNCPTGQQIPVEERAASEVRGVIGAFGSLQWAKESVEVFNPAFDVTPADLVSGWILDRGLFDQAQVKRGIFKSEEF